LLTAQIKALDARIETVIAPFGLHVERFDEITGVGVTAARDLLSLGGHCPVFGAQDDLRHGQRADGSFSTTFNSAVAFARSSSDA
jgi:hypothetical protein